MKYRKFLGATMIAAALMTTVAACGSGGGSEITDGSNPPSIAALNEMVDQAVDPDIPRAEKVS